ncbi:Cytokinesis protein sepH [Spathaspora sp. JA1]|nr:Cytokinesis protein sepH [Spathaspora sp. JA1]
MQSIPINQISQLRDMGEITTRFSSNYSSTDKRESTLAKYRETSSDNLDLDGFEEQDLSFSKFSSGGSVVVGNPPKSEESDSVNDSPFVKRISNKIEVQFDNGFNNERVVFPISEVSRSNDENQDSPFLESGATSKFDAFDGNKQIRPHKLRNKHLLTSVAPKISTPKHQRTSSVKVSLTPAQKFEKKVNTRSDNALDSFEFGTLVGNGAFASVYKGVNLKTNQVVAIKQIKLEKDQDVAVLMGEIDLLKILKHPNIVKYHGFVKTTTSLNVLLEYCAGGSLRQLYKKMKRGLPESQIINYVRQILNGLTYLHDQGVVHRDVKAANVLLTDSGDVKLADFGVATRVNASHYTVVGTPNWMAPETVIGGEGLCTASDIWSLGATIIELFTMYPPYHDYNPMQTLHAIGTDEHPPLPKSLSSFAKNFLLECFQKQPNLRTSAKLLLKHRWLNEGVTTVKSSRLNLQVPKRQPSIELKSILSYKEPNDDENWEKDFSEMKLSKVKGAVNPDLIHLDDIDSEFEQETEERVKYSKVELLTKFAEGNSGNSEFADLEHIDTEKFIDQENIEVDDVGDSDPFLNIEIESFDTNDLEVQSKMEYLISRYSRKLDQGRSENEEAVASLVKITGRMLHLIKKYPVSHDTFIRDHGVLSILDLLDSYQEIPHQQQLWYHALSILNYIFENNIGVFENFCFLGGIPAIAHFRNVSYDIQVRLQVVRFVRLLNSSDKALSMFVSCGGFRLVAKFVEEDFDSTPTFPLVAVECIHNVLSRDLIRSKSDMCRILSKHGLVFWFMVLLNRLLKFGREESYKNVSWEDIHVTIDRIIEIIKYFGQSEIRVRITIASVDVFKLMIKVYDQLSSEHQVIILKFFKSMSCVSELLKFLYRAEILEFMFRLLKIHTPSNKNYKDFINVVSPILYNCLSLNYIREAEFVELGGLTYLKSLSKINLPFKQFILPIICELAYCDEKVRTEMKKQDILSVYYNLLLDPYWQPNSLESIYHWYRTDPTYITLESPKAIDCLIAGFLLPKVSNLESTLDIYLQLISINSKVTKFMSNAVIINNILMKLKLHNKNPVIQLLLLKILKWLVLSCNTVEMNVSTSITNCLHTIAKTSSSVLIEEIALEILEMIPISYPSPRVAQLDAHILDSELFSLLKEQFSSIFHLHNNSKYSYDQNPELYSLLLNLVIFKLTVWKTGASYGLSLQNLKLTDVRNAKIIGFSKRGLLLAILVGGYAYEKLQSYLYGIDGDGNENGSSTILGRLKDYIIRNRTVMLTKIDNCLKVANLVNFTIFLVNGKYPSVMHRILGISLTPLVSDLLKFTGDNVNYEFQNRQLVWNVMTEFLVFILPLLQLSKLNKMTRKLLLRQGGREDGMEIQVGKSGPVFTPYTNLPVSECAICHENNNQIAAGGRTSACHITNPYITNCGHVYCYVCIATRFNVIKTRGEDMPCLRCGQRLEWFHEFGSDELAIDEDAIIVSGDEQDSDEEEEQEEDDENASVASEDEEEDIEPYDSLKVHRTTTRIDRRMSAVSPVFDEDSNESQTSEAEYSEEEDFDEEEAFM